MRAGNKDEKRVPAIIRFDPEWLRQIDKAAKKRGISRAAWIQFIASRAIENREG